MVLVLTEVASDCRLQGHKDHILARSRSHARSFVRQASNGFTAGQRVGEDTIASHPAQQPVGRQLCWYLQAASTDCASGSIAFFGSRMALCVRSNVRSLVTRTPLLTYCVSCSSYRRLARCTRKHD